MKHLFIINPAAGKGKTLKNIPEIKRAFSGREDHYIIEITEKPGHAVEIARHYSQRDFYRIYSVGGDGTLNEVLNGMAGSGCSLADIPSGTGNDFIRSIIPGGSYQNIIERTVRGREETIDLAKVNDRYFINITSAGFDAEVAFNAAKFKRLPGVMGSMSYILGIFTGLARCRNLTMEINIDGMQFTSVTLLTAIANGRFYGGGMLPAPGARIDDGHFDICHVGGMRRSRILRLFPKYMKGDHGNFKEVTFFKGKRVEIRCSEDMALNMDGEVSIVREAIFEIIPKGLKFIVPM